GSTTAAARLAKTIELPTFDLPWSHVQGESQTPPATVATQLSFPADAGMLAFVLTPALDVVLTCVTTVFVSRWRTETFQTPIGPSTSTFLEGLSNVHAYAVWTKTGAIV